MSSNTTQYLSLQPNVPNTVHFSQMIFFPFESGICFTHACSISFVGKQHNYGAKQGRRRQKQKQHETLPSEAGQSTLFLHCDNGLCNLAIMIFPQPVYVKTGSLGCVHMWGSAHGHVWCVSEGVPLGGKKGSNLGRLTATASYHTGCGKLLCARVSHCDWLS